MNCCGPGYLMWLNPGGSQKVALWLRLEPQSADRVSARLYRAEFSTEKQRIYALVRLVFRR